MVQVINDPNRKNFADTFSSGLSNLIQGLTQHKAEQMHYAKEHRELRNAFPELPEGALNFLASQPPKERFQYLQSFAESLQQEQEMQQQQQMQSQQEQQQERGGLENLLQQAQQQAQKPAIPYAPGYKGPKQAEFGGTEQQQALQQAEQIKQQLAKPAAAVQPMAKKPMTLTKALAANKPAVSEKQQLQINKSNKPFIDKMNAYITDAKERKAFAESALNEVKSGNVSSGLIGLLPEKLLTSVSSANNNFIKSTSALANRKALELRGPVGKAKLEAAQREKAALNDPTESQEQVLKYEIKHAIPAEALSAAYEEIMAEHGDVEPANLERKVRVRAKQIEKELEKEFEEKYSAKTEKNNLPDPREYEVGSVIEVDDVQYKKDQSGQWIQV